METNQLHRRRQGLLDTYPVRQTTLARLRVIALVIVGVIVSSGTGHAAIAGSKLGRFIYENWTPDGTFDDRALIRSLRKAGLVKSDVADDKLIAVFKEAREEDEDRRAFNSVHERVRVFLVRDLYLTDKGQKWAVPLKSLDLPD
jgi:hypothetical protein